MVWGGICAAGKTPLVFIEKGVKINARYYQDKVLKVVLLWSPQHFPLNDMIFQPDWATRSRSKIVDAPVRQHLPRSSHQGPLTFQLA